MENASKALIMAAGILLGVILLTIFMLTYGNVTRIQREKLSEEEIEQLAIFNREYESYNKKLLRGVEVVSVLNKAYSNNQKYDNEEYYKIDVEVGIIKPITTETETLIAGPYNISTYVSKIKNNAEIFEEFKRKIFDCVTVQYDSESGRVDYMVFLERNDT